MPQRLITDSMSFRDIIEITQKDVPMVRNNLYKDVAPKYLQYLRQRRRNLFPPQPQLYAFNGNRGLNYYVLMFNDSETDFKKDPKSQIFAYCIRKDGFLVLSIHSLYHSLFKTEKEAYTFYTSHFFDRYRERIIGDMQLDKRKAIEHFISNNYLPAKPVSQIDKDIENGLLLIHANCYAFGYYEDEGELSCMKTCVNFNQLFDSQTQIKEVAQKMIQELLAENPDI